MRAAIVIVGIGALVGACGGSKPEPKEPSSEPSQAYDDTPKWEGATASQSEEPKANPGQQVHEKAPPSKNSYDKEATEVVLKRSARLVKDNCGAAKNEDGKATGPWGTLTVEVVLGANGHGKGVTVPEPYAGKPVGNCIEKAFANLTFPPWGGSDTTVPWEVELVNPTAK